MTNPGSDQFEQIIDLFEELRVADPITREERLDSGEIAPAVAARLRQMFRAAAREDSLLDEPILMRVRDGVDAMDDETPPSLRGYTIIKRIAHGGMGVVYLAHQHPPADREVAIKMIRPGAPRSFTERFAHEQSVLAQLNHPNIAAIYQVGTTESGQPYLAMEKVEGASILDHCDQHRLSVAARIELFEQVLRAVLFCHQRGVLHGDIKPSNVLVRQLDEGSDVSKLIDFGIASELDSAAAAQRIGTPAYMSPEQLDKTGLRDARSDIYSCGVLLSELLLGQRARSAADCQLRDRYRDLGPDERRTLAHARGTTEAAMDRQMTSELGWIIEKAIRENADERYATAADFLRDLTRLAANEPTDAGPNHWQYRARLWVRRNRAAAAFGFIGAMMISLFIAVLWWQSAQITREYERAQSERDTAREVETLLVELFSQADPFNAVNPEDISALDLLDRGWANLKENKILPPPTRTRLLIDMAQAYGSLGKYDRVAEIADLLLMEDDWPDRESKVELHTRAAVYAGRAFDIETAYRHARVAVQASEHPDVSERLRLYARLRLAETHMHADEASHCVDDLETLIPDVANFFGTESLDYADALHTLGFCYSQGHENEKAVVFLEESIAIKARLFGSSDLSVAAGRGNLSVAFSNMGEHDKAIEQITSSLTVRRDRLGPEHPDTLVSLENLALAYANAGRQEDALATLQEATPVVIKLHGDRSLVYLRHLNTLGYSLDEMGRIEDGYEQRLKTFELTTRHLTDNAHMIGLTAFNLAASCVKLKLFDCAADKVAIAKDAWAKIYSPTDPIMGFVETMKAKVAIGQKKFALAAQAGSEAVAILGQHIGDDHWRHAIATAAWAYASIRAADGATDIQTLRELLHQSLVHLENQERPRSSDAALVRSWLAEI